MSSYFECDIVDDQTGLPQLSVNPRFHHPEFVTVGNIIIHAVSRAMLVDSPQRLHVGMLIPGQSDVEDVGPLRKLWLAINHQIFTRVANECLAAQSAPSLAKRVRPETTYDEFVQMVAECSSVPRSFLLPNFEYIEATRDFCHHHEIQWVPKPLLVGVSFLLGRVKERRTTRCTHWESHVLEFSLSQRMITLVDRRDHHLVPRPGTGAVSWANLLVIE
jgi:hypothetical protein